MYPTSHVSVYFYVGGTGGNFGGVTWGAHKQLTPRQSQTDKLFIDKVTLEDSVPA